MPQVVPIHFELTLIKHVNEFMYERGFHVFLVEELPGAEHDGTWIRAESARPRQVAGCAEDV